MVEPKIGGQRVLLGRNYCKRSTTIPLENRTSASKIVALVTMNKVDHGNQETNKVIARPTQKDARNYWVKQ